MKNKKLNITDFILKYWVSFVLILLFVFLLYSVKLFHFSISMDTEILISDYSKQLMMWNSLGRFSLLIIKFLLHMKSFNYYSSILFMVIFFSVAIYLLYYILYLFSNHEPKNFEILIFGFIIASSPIFAEQFYFTLQCAEVAFALLVFDLVLYFYLKYISNRNKKDYIVALLLFVFCLGCYQSF